MILFAIIWSAAIEFEAKCKIAVVIVLVWSLEPVCIELAEKCSKC